MIRWKRLLRTPHSERFVALRDGREAGYVDIHYLGDGRVFGSVVLLSGAGWSEEQVPDLLASLDEEFLPEVDLARGDLQYHVVIGEAIGSFESHTGDEVAT
jgi:hypothetical protein